MLPSCPAIALGGVPEQVLQGTDGGREGGREGGKEGWVVGRLPPKCNHLLIVSFSSFPPSLPPSSIGRRIQVCAALHPCPVQEGGADLEVETCVSGDLLPTLFLPAFVLNSRREVVLSFKGGREGRRVYVYLCV